MSEYLNRLKQRRDATPPPGNAKNVQSNVSFRKAIDYIEDLEHKIVLAENQERYLLTRLKEADKLNGQQLITNAAQRRKHDERRGSDRENLINIIRNTCEEPDGGLHHSNVVDLINEYYGSN